jgi:integrase
MLALLTALEGHEPYRTLAALCCYCGLRVGEALGLRWGDLSETAAVLRLERQSLHEDRRLEELKHARQRRTMALPAPLVPVLAAHRARQGAQGRARAHDLLFPGGDYARTGLPLSHKAVWKAVAAAEERAGLPAGVALHGLRHGHATLALAAGASVKDVQERLGHADLATTARYLHRAGTGDAAVARRVGRALRGP